MQLPSKRIFVSISILSYGPRFTNVLVRQMHIQKKSATEKFAIHRNTIV